VGPSLAVIGGSTFTIGAGATPTTTVINGQTISIGPNGVGLASTTIAPGITAAPGANLSPVTVDGVTFSVGAPIAVISGITFTIGPNAVPTTEVVNGKTISVGPNGIGFSDTTIAIPSGVSGLKPETADGITFSAGQSIVVIDGTTFTVGPGATATTKVVNGKTLSIGPSGVALASTTSSSSSSTKTSTSSSTASSTAKPKKGSASRFEQNAMVALAAAFGGMLLL
jgi:hypothetical protein